MPAVRARWFNGTQKTPPACELMPPSMSDFSTTIVFMPRSCPAIAPAQPATPEPIQIQSKVSDHLVTAARAMDGTAAAGHDRGMKTIVVEKSDMLGGISSQ